MITVACVLKSGGDFDADYVDRLKKGVKLYLEKPHRFVCFSDIDVPCERIPLKYNFPGWWSKMELFRPDTDLEDIFYLDLDTVIVGKLNDLVSMHRPRMLNGGQSAVMSLPKEFRDRVWKEWIINPQHHMNELGLDEKRKDISRSSIYSDLSNIGDQAFVRRIHQPDDYPDGFFCSYMDVVEATSPAKFGGPTVLTKPRKIRLPSNIAAVIFYNNPRPRDVNWLENMEFKS